MKVKSTNQDNHLRLIDITKIEPKKDNVRSFGLMATYDMVGNVYVLIPKDYVNLVHEEIWQIFSKTNNVVGGCTKLPDGNGLLIRLLGSFVFDIQQIIFSILAIVRKNILNISFGKIRKA